MELCVSKRDEDTRTCEELRFETRGDRSVIEKAINFGANFK